jgi:prolyl oligopeptidase
LHRTLLIAALTACAGHKTPTGNGEEPGNMVETLVPAPDARRGDTVDVFDGVSVADPYRWLEDPDSPETRAWIDANNVRTEDYLGATSTRDAIRDRLREVWNYERRGVPTREAGDLWFRRNDGLQQQAPLFRSAETDGAPELVLDPNTFSTDGTVALADWAVDREGKYLAYGVSDGGSDWTTWKVRDLASGSDLGDEIRWTKFGTATWLPDGSAFLYQRFPEPVDGVDANRNQKMYLHVLGTEQSADRVVVERPDEPDQAFYPRITDDGTLMVVTQVEGTAELNRVYVAPLTSGTIGEIRPVLDEFDAWYGLLGNVGKTLYFFTNKDAPRGRVIAVELADPSPAKWREVVPQGQDTLTEVVLVQDRLVGRLLHDAASRLNVWTIGGEDEGPIQLPGLGTANELTGHQDGDEVFFQFVSYSQPSTVYRYEVSTGALQALFEPEIPMDLSDIHTEQIFVESKDGTRVPAFVSYKGELVRNGSRPTLLYGYGGFNIPKVPEFEPTFAVWMEMGGVFVVPGIRGGGEYGREWHEAGTLARKQNTFDDFIAVAEHLVKAKITSVDKLAIHGRSNGGLLVGAVLTQRPELFGAALPAVGVMDMLRYHLWTIGWAWASDYGTVDDPALFPILHSYSPVHNARPAAYPPTLITTADHDDRVVPAHSYKFGAALQHAQQGDEPILVRIDTRAGHGAGKALSMLIDERADQLAFLVEALDVDVDSD